MHHYLMWNITNKCVEFWNKRVMVVRTYLHLVGRGRKVSFTGCCSTSWGRSSIHWSRAKRYIVGIFSPLPGVDHEVAESRTCRHQGLCLPGLDRGGLDDGHQNSFRRVVAKNNVRVLILCHRWCIEKNSLKSKCQLNGKNPLKSRAATHMVPNAKYVFQPGVNNPVISNAAE